MDLTSVLRSCNHDHALWLSNARANDIRFKLWSLRMKRTRSSSCIRESLEILDELDVASRSYVVSHPLVEWAISSEIAGHGDGGLGVNHAVKFAMEASDSIANLTVTAAASYSPLLSRIIENQRMAIEGAEETAIDDSKFAYDEIRWGVDWIGRTLPGGLSEFSIFGRVVVPIKGEAIAGTSLSNATGVSFVRPEPDRYETVDHLIHERSHNKFGIVIQQHPMWNEDGRLFRSPLRPDPRPANGIFHAVYVLLVVTDSFLRAAEHGDCPREAADDRAANYLPRIREGVQVLRTEVNLTDAGGLFTDEAMKWAKELAG